MDLAGSVPLFAFFVLFFSVTFVSPCLSKTAFVGNSFFAGFPSVDDLCNALGRPDLKGKVLTQKDFLSPPPPPPFVPPYTPPDWATVEAEIDYERTVWEIGDQSWKEGYLSRQPWSGWNVYAKSDQFDTMSKDSAKKIKELKQAREASAYVHHFNEVAGHSHKQMVQQLLQKNTSQKYKTFPDIIEEAKRSVSHTRTRALMISENPFLVRPQNVGNFAKALDQKVSAQRLAQLATSSGTYLDYGRFLFAHADALQLAGECSADQLKCFLTNTGDPNRQGVEDFLQKVTGSKFFQKDRTGFRKIFKALKNNALKADAVQIMKSYGNTCQDAAFTGLEMLKVLLLLEQTKGRPMAEQEKSALDLTFFVLKDHLLDTYAVDAQDEDNKKHDAAHPTCKNKDCGNHSRNKEILEYALSIKVLGRSWLGGDVPAQENYLELYGPFTAKGLAERLCLDKDQILISAADSTVWKTYVDSTQRMQDAMSAIDWSGSPEDLVKQQEQQDLYRVMLKEAMLKNGYLAKTPYYPWRTPSVA